MHEAIQPSTLLRAAHERFGAEVEVSAPYWVDQEVVRVGVSLDKGNPSFGANFHFRSGKFS
jgi:hypothetical protein